MLKIWKPRNPDFNPLAKGLQVLSLKSDLNYAIVVYSDSQNINLVKATKGSAFLLSRIENSFNRPKFLTARSSDSNEQKLIHKAIAQLDKYTRQIKDLNYMLIVHSRSLKIDAYASYTTTKYGINIMHDAAIAQASLIRN